jgi:hypothetical protein
MKLTSFFRRIFDPKQRRRDLYCAAIIKRWKQNAPEVWRWNMLGLWHWGLLDKDDLAAMFTAKGLGPPRQNEFKPHHQDCTNLISWLVKQLVTWNAVMGEPVYEYPLEDFPPDAGKS